jgi:hypothetical protein
MVQVEYYDDNKTDNRKEVVITGTNETEQQVDGKKEPELSEEDIVANLSELNDKLKIDTEIELQRELKQKLEEVNNNLNIFQTWMNDNYKSGNLYVIFAQTFDAQYRSDLFENMVEYFECSDLVTNELLFNWKIMIYDLLKSNKKYKSYLEELVFDIDSRNTNLGLNRSKYVFRCFIDGNPLCYFKENGNDYYVS